MVLIMELFIILLMFTSIYGFKLLRFVYGIKQLHNAIIIIDTKIVNTNAVLDIVSLPLFIVYPIMMNRITAIK